MVNNPDLVLRYRNRAEELRVIAQATKDTKVRADLEKWAKQYELMATSAARLKPPSNPGQFSD